jgi:branched-chain amino acid transport system permease protein
LTPARRDLTVALAAAAALAAVPVAAARGFYLMDLGFFTFLFVSQSVAWNLLGGFAGQVSFGYASFLGLGAYATAILWLHGWPPLLTLPVGAAVAAAFAWFIGTLCFRLTGPYFAIATLGVGEAMRVLMLNWNSLTGGSSGLNLPTVVPPKAWFYLLALGLALLAFLVAWWARYSPFGLGLFALRMDETAAADLGVDTALWKNVAHALGAALVAAGGGLDAWYFQYVHPDQVFGFQNSIAMVLMPVIGGVGSLWGPVLGGAFFYVLQDVLSAFPSLHLGVYGLLLVFVILFEPGGLTGLAARLARRRPAARGLAL